MKRKAGAALCLTALLLTACAERTSSGVGETAPVTVQTEPAETEPAETGASAQTETAAAPEITVTAETAPETETSDEPEQSRTRSLSECEEEARSSLRAEQLARDYDEKHAAYLQGALYAPPEDPARWRAAYAAFLSSGEYLYAMPRLKPDAVYCFALLHAEDSDAPNLVITPDPGAEYAPVFFFRYTDGTVQYADTCMTDHYNGSFSYRPYRGAIGHTSGSVMNEGIFLNFWQIGDDTYFCIPPGRILAAAERAADAERVAEVLRVTEEDLPAGTEFPTEEAAAQLDVSLKDGTLGSSWLTVDTRSEAFQPIGPETVAQLTETAQ